MVEICLAPFIDSSETCHLVPRYPLGDRRDTWAWISLTDAISMIRKSRSLLHQRSKERGVKLPPPSQLKPGSIRRYIMGEKEDLSQYRDALNTNFWSESSEQDLSYFLTCEACLLSMESLIGGRKCADLGIKRKTDLVEDWHITRANREGYGYRIRELEGLDDFLAQGQDLYSPQQEQRSELDWDEILEFRRGSSDSASRVSQTDSDYEPELEMAAAKERSPGNAALSAEEIEERAMALGGLTLGEGSRQVACSYRCVNCGFLGEVILRVDGGYSSTCDICEEEMIGPSY